MESNQEPNSIVDQISAMSTEDDCNSDEPCLFCQRRSAALITIIGLMEDYGLEDVLLDILNDDEEDCEEDEDDGA